MRAQLFVCLIVGLQLVVAGCGAEMKKQTSTTTTTSSDKAADQSVAFDATSADLSRFASETKAIVSSDLTDARIPIRARAEVTVESHRAPTVEAHRSDTHEAVRLQTAPTRAASPTLYRAGTLTAGSFDDHARYRDYREYLSLAMQRDPSESLPRLAMGERLVVRVVNEKNQPVNDAVVELHAPETQQSARVTQRTGSDGRAVFLSNLDHFHSDGELVTRVVAFSPQSAENTVNAQSLPTAAVDRTGGETTIVYSAAPRNLSQKLDLSLVIDTTGSMSDELEYLKTEIDAIAATVHKRFPNVDQRYSLVVYRDEGDEYVSRKFDFTGSLSEFQASLSTQFANGGGDYPEAMHLALEQADSLDWRKDNTARVMFLVADAPPHRRFAGQAIEAIQKLRAKGVTIFPVAASGVQEEAEFVLRGTAFLTRGRYLFLTDHSGVGNPHARPNVPDYEVERLDQLMIRMIAWKLSGDETGMQEIIATSHGDDAARQGASIPVEQNNGNQSSGPSATAPSARRPSRSAAPGLFVSIVAELWRSDFWLRPNRYWLFGLIIVGVFLLDRREVRRRRALCPTTYACQKPM